jgi:NTE family protein
MQNQAFVRQGLVLTGGGARAAYQVGVLRAISVLTKLEKCPFSIISGFSAGAINGTWLGSQWQSFDYSTKSMWTEWATMNSEKIFRTDLSSVSGIALRWLRDIGSGGMERHRHITYLLDTSPLYNFIRTRIDFNALNANLLSNNLYGLSVTAANYQTGHSTAFFLGNSQIKEWERLNRISVRTAIAPEHVMASAAIPIFFPPVRVGKFFYGDGMIRLNAPLSPAVHLGAEQLLVIGVRGPSSITADNLQDTSNISIGEIAGTILNSLFFDSLDADLARLSRVNRTLSVMTEEQLKKNPDQLRSIPLLYLKPSEEIAGMSTCELARLPATLRYLLKGLGLTEQKGLDLLSYLSFEPKYLRSLLELGYEDTIKRKDEVLSFFAKERNEMRREGQEAVQSMH